MRSGGVTIFLWAALAAYAIWLGGRFSSEPGGSDASGYLNSARLLTEGRLETTQRAMPEIGHASCRFFQPLGFQADEASTRLVPTYPIGLPLHFAVAATLFGWHFGPMVVVVGAATAALVVCYLIVRQLGGSRLFAAMGAASLAMCAVFIHPSVQPYSDTVATLWCAIAMLAAMRAEQGSRWNLILCGVAVGLAVLVRPTDAVLCPAIALLLGNWRRVVAVFFAALPWFVGLAVCNRHLYGSPLVFGYGDVSVLFSLAYGWPTLVHFAYYLARTLPLLVTLLVSFPFLPWRQRSREIAGLWLWIGALVGLYACYDYSRTNWWFLRFIEPALPAAVALACVGLEQAAARWSMRRPNRLRPMIVAILLAIGLGASATFRVPNGRAHDQMYAAAASWLRVNVPSNAAIVCMECSGMVFFQSANPILRWDFLDNPRESARILNALHAADRPIFALLVPEEVADPRLRRFRANWKKVADLDGVTAWKLN